MVPSELPPRPSLVAYRPSRLLALAAALLFIGAALAASQVIEGGDRTTLAIGAGVLFAGMSGVSYWLANWAWPLFAGVVPLALVVIAVVVIGGFSGAVLMYGAGLAMLCLPLVLWLVAAAVLGTWLRSRVVTRAGPPPEASS